MIQVRYTSAHIGPLAHHVIISPAVTWQHISGFTATFPCTCVLLCSTAVLSKFKVSWRFHSAGAGEVEIGVMVTSPTSHVNKRPPPWDKKFLWEVRGVPCLLKVIGPNVQSSNSFATCLSAGWPNNLMISRRMAASNLWYFAYIIAESCYELAMFGGHFKSYSWSLLQRGLKLCKPLNILSC